MKWQIISIGKANETYVNTGIQEFTSRIQRYAIFEWIIIAPPKNAASLDAATLKKEEAKLIIEKLDANDYVILLDERGKLMDSIGFAEQLQQRMNAASKKVIFIIGGAFGVDEKIFNRAQLVLSLSKLVFPHMLVRLILAEQLYRGFSILKNEKYHHI